MVSVWTSLVNRMININFNKKTGLAGFFVEIYLLILEQLLEPVYQAGEDFIGFFDRFRCG